MNSHLRSPWISSPWKWLSLHARRPEMPLEKKCEDWTGVLATSVPEGPSRRETPDRVKATVFALLALTQHPRLCVLCFLCRQETSPTRSTARGGRCWIHTHCDFMECFPSCLPLSLGKLAHRGDWKLVSFACVLELNKGYQNVHVLSVFKLRL